MRQPGRRAKIICTIGPAVDNQESVTRLVEEGMDVARLNFSHGDHATHQKRIEWLRKASKALHIPVAILVDIQGPKIRTAKIIGGKKMALTEGQVLWFTGGAHGRDSEPGDGSREKPISISYPRLAADLHPGDALLFDDGLVRMETVSNDPERNLLQAKVIFGQFLGENKGVNMPDAKLSTLGITEKDWADILFAVEADVDFIALSFVRTPREVKNLKQFLVQKNSPIQIVSKIEKPEAVENIDEILEHSDSIMVARGDLAVEIGNDLVPLEQKKLVRKARRAGKPVIIATQMLMSMVDNPTPSRAEASDIANAVLDGADALMLSNETASGNFPFEAVKTMATIIRTTEEHEGSDYMPKRFVEKRFTGQKLAPKEAIGQAATTVAENIGARALICVTASGEAARIIAQNRPNMPIFAFTDNEKVRHQLSLSWGVSVVPWHEEGALAREEVFDTLMVELGRLGMLKENDLAVITTGIPTTYKTGSTNAIVVRRLGPQPTETE